jgi:hypothetical protein
MGSGGKGPLHAFLISALDGGEWSASCSHCFNPGDNVLGTTGLETGLAQESVWTRWRREKCLPLPGIERRSSGSRPVALLTDSRKIFEWEVREGA